VSREGDGGTLGAFRWAGDELGVEGPRKDASRPLILWEDKESQRDKIRLCYLDPCF